MMNNTRMGGLAVLMSSLFLLSALPTGSAADVSDHEVQFEALAPLLASDGVEIDTNSQITTNIVAIVEKAAGCDPGRQSKIGRYNIPSGTSGVYWDGDDLKYSIKYWKYDVYRYNYQYFGVCVAAAEAVYAGWYEREYTLVNGIGSAIEAIAIAS